MRRSVLERKKEWKRDTEPEIGQVCCYKDDGRTSLRRHVWEKIKGREGIKTCRYLEKSIVAEGRVSAITLRQEHAWQVCKGGKKGAGGEWREENKYTIKRRKYRQMSCFKKNKLLKMQLILIRCGISGCSKIIIIILKISSLKREVNFLIARRYRLKLLLLY